LKPHNAAEAGGRKAMTDMSGDKKKDKSPIDDVLVDSIVTYSGHFEEHSLKRIANRCVRSVIGERFQDLCGEAFSIPSQDQMRDLVVEEMKQYFEDQLVPIIERRHPDLSDEKLDAVIEQFYRQFEAEYTEQIDSTTNAAIRELRVRIKAVQKELAAVKRKYAGAVGP
jgi:uncharacterized membrane protein YheB (UPF0754 family)